MEAKREASVLTRCSNRGTLWRLLNRTKGKTSKAAKTSRSKIRLSRRLLRESRIAALASTSSDRTHRAQTRSSSLARL